MISDHRRILENLATKLSLPNLHDICLLDPTSPDYPTQIISHYGGSLPIAIHSLFPSKNFHLWLYTKNIPTSYWRDEYNRKMYLEWLGNQLNFKKKEDWYQVN